MTSKKRTTNTKKEPFFLSGKFIYAIQSFVSVLAIWAILKLNLLPTKYLLVALGSITLLALTTAAIVKKKLFKGKSALKVLSLLLSLAMGMGTLYAFNGETFIDGITGANKDTHVISVVVMKDSGYDKFDDVKDFAFGANTAQDNEAIEQAKELIATKYKADISIDPVEGYITLAEQLISGNREVILLNEAHRSFITDNDDSFNEITKVIAEVSYQVESAITDYNTNVNKDTFSIFLSGIDTYGPVSSTSRSDVNMIVTVNPNTNQILLTSIPRDYHVILPKFNQYDKLTHAGIYGVGESVAAMENLLGIDIDYYAKVNFSSVTKIVDALGGVNVNSQWTFTGPQGYQFTKGDNFVDGAKALSFVRERYSLPGGDNSRVINQQALVTGILNKAMSPAIITNFNSVLNSIDGAFEMSMPSSDFKSLIKTQADSMKSWEIIDIQLTGYGTHSTTTASMPGWNLYVMTPDQGSVNMATELILSMENNNMISKP